MDGRSNKHNFSNDKQLKTGLVLFALVLLYDSYSDSDRANVLAFFLFLSILKNLFNKFFPINNKQTLFPSPNYTNRIPLEFQPRESSEESKKNFEKFKKRFKKTADELRSRTNKK